MLRFASIVLLGIAAAVIYGLIHDQITIRICPEYFTILHPQILPSDTSLTVLALAWGVAATWWVGLILGIILAYASRAGTRPPLFVRDLLVPVAWLLLIMAIGATCAGFIGHFLASNGYVPVGAEVRDVLPPDRVVPAITDLWTHLASYAFGFVGGIVLAVLAYRRRSRIPVRAV